jgi:hypothetical protein
MLLFLSYVQENVKDVTFDNFTMMHQPPTYKLMIKDDVQLIIGRYAVLTPMNDSPPPSSLFL